MRRVKGLECEFSGELCYDPRCKVGFCIEGRKLSPLRAEAARQKTAKPLDREVARVAKQVAKEEARRRGIVATPERIAKAMKHPRVLEEARRRIDVIQNIVNPGKSR
jgi:hypothetical protein